MWLLIDHSNRFTKFALGAQGSFQRLRLVAESEGLADWERGLAGELGGAAGRLCGVAICSVRRDGARVLEHWCEVLGGLPGFMLDHRNAGLDLRDHAHPEVIGTDRLANLRGAAADDPEGAVIVIDAGTAVTFDPLIPGKPPRFPGGAIAPGIDVMGAALGRMADRLPEVGARQVREFQPDAVENRTVRAIGAGLRHGFRGMVRELVPAQMEWLAEHGYPVEKVLVTGGDGAAVLDALEGLGDLNVRHDPGLTLRGLWSVLMDYEGRV